MFWFQTFYVQQKQEMGGMEGNEYDKAGRAKAREPQRNGSAGSANNRFTWESRYGGVAVRGVLKSIGRATTKLCSWRLERDVR